MVRRALALVKAGQLRRAASSLLQKGIHDPTSEVVEQLKRLHLSAPEHPLPVCPREAPSPSFTSFAVRDYLRERAPRGSAPGLSGWTESLLLPLVEDAHLLLAITSFLEDIANGRIDRASRERLLSCRLIPAKKKDGGVRPIAVSEVFLRAATALSLRLVPPGVLSHLLTPIQLGLGSAGGTEAVIHRVQALLERHADHVLLSLDLANGFNSMFRHVMLERLYALPELSLMWRVADLCYGVPSPLHLFGRDGLVASFVSERGSRQGCVLGTLLFCLGLQPILEQASRDLTELSVSAYIDDLTAVGPLELVDVFFQRLITSTSSAGLTVSLPKSSLLWPSGQSVPEHVRRWATERSVPLACRAVPLLGSMVGLDSTLREHSAADRVTSMEPFLRALRHPSFTTQAAFLLLRVCALPKFNFTCRTLPPQLTLPACETFDSLVFNTAVGILHLDPSCLGDASTLLTLPIKHGGFGLRRMKLTAPAAYLGSLAAAAPHLPAQLLDAAPFIREIEHALSYCRLPGLRVPSADSFLARAARRPPRALQHTITAAVEDAVTRAVDADPGLSSHLLSLRQTGAANWLTVTPSRPELSLADDDFRLAARLRLRLHPSTPVPGVPCACGEELEADHFMVCQHLKRHSVTARHAIVLQLLVSFLRDAGLGPIPEARTEHGERPDLRMFLDGASMMLDLSITHPSSRSALVCFSSSCRSSEARGGEEGQVR